MSKPNVAQIAMMLVERQQICDQKIATAEREQRPATALFWRVVKAEAEALYGWVADDENYIAQSLLHGKEIRKSLGEWDWIALEYQIAMAKEAAHA